MSTKESPSLLSAPLFVTASSTDESAPAEQDLEDDLSSHDLLTFLAVAQKAELPILPITWLDTAELRKGGTSQVQESLINQETSLAFKRVRRDDKQGTSSTNASNRKTFEALINEILVLYHPRLRPHPLTVDLEGIYWDILDDNHMWPVLVFEKPLHGDLEQFLSEPAGRNLDLIDRLFLMNQVECAIRDIHSNGKVL